jgi:hypothetical protein
LRKYRLERKIEVSGKGRWKWKETTDADHYRGDEGQKTHWDSGLHAASFVVRSEGQTWCPDVKRSP